VTLPEYELYAIRYAGHPRTRRENLLGDDERPDAPMPIDYFVWAARGPGGEAWVVDTGFVAANAAKRGRHMERTPAEGLALVGIDAARVTDVVLTHVHLDHAGGAGHLMRHLPAARLAVHPRGVAHRADPAKLWAGWVRGQTGGVRCISSCAAMGRWWTRRPGLAGPNSRLRDFSPTKCVLRSRKAR
jgi:glyoxylase-like metal-dependent hydrolase (beta-lactamase superfamily II)